MFKKRKYRSTSSEAAHPVFQDFLLKFFTDITNDDNSNEEFINKLKLNNFENLCLTNYSSVLTNNQKVKLQEMQKCVTALPVAKEGEQGAIYEYEDPKQKYFTLLQEFLQLLPEAEQSFCEKCSEYTSKILNTALCFVTAVTVFQFVEYYTQQGE